MRGLICRYLCATMKLNRLLAAGYFPKELPPPFTTAHFAALAAAGLPAQFSLKPKGGFHSRPAQHNLARSGTLRRKLSIPNPVNMYQVAEAVVSNWPQLLRQTRKSTLSLTRPLQGGPSRRAIAPQHEFKAIPIARARCRAGSRYVLRADINNFYPSIYTHSVSVRRSPS